jgi:hypothetical protein
MLFCMTHSLSVSHVCGNLNHFLGSKNFALARAKARLYWKFSLMLRVSFILNLIHKRVQ